MQLVQFLTNCGTQLFTLGVGNPGRNWYTWSGHLGTHLTPFLDRGTQLILPQREHITNNTFSFPYSANLLIFWARWQNCGNRLLASSCLPVCLSVRPSAWNNSVPTGRFFMKFDLWDLIENLSRKFIFDLCLTRITYLPTSHDYLCPFAVICRWILLGFRNISDKFGQKNKTHILCSIYYFPKI